MQLRTLRGINLTMKDIINNPLAVIHAYLRRVEARWAHDQETADDIKSLRGAAERIHGVAEQFGNVKDYRAVNQSYGTVVDI